MMRRKILLGCGIVSSLLYVATDILASRRYPGYSYKDQAFSELMAQGAPTRRFMVALNVIPYDLLVAAFARGVWTAAGGRRVARLTPALLLGYAVSGVAGGGLFPMPRRGTKGTRRNGMHIPALAVQSLSLMMAMGVGGTLLGKRFRYYSCGTILALLVGGALASVQIPRMAANQPTPWAGIAERINIYATMLWLAVLALALLRVEGARAPRRVGQPTVTPR